jgi:hypothetical protein
MPSKSPANPTRPKLERSRFGDGIGLKVIAFAIAVTDVNKSPSRINGGGSPVEGLSHEVNFIADPANERITNLLVLPKEGDRGIKLQAGRSSRGWLLTTAHRIETRRRRNTITIDSSLYNYRNPILASGFVLSCVVRYLSPNECRNNWIIREVRRGENQGERYGSALVASR